MTFATERARFTLRIVIAVGKWPAPNVPLGTLNFSSAVADAHDADAAT
jgi:hypothetical protein